MSQDALQHIGIIRRSGRYPWGSGNQPYQHGSDNFLSYVTKLKQEGMNEVEIANALNMSVEDFRSKRSVEKDRQRVEDAAYAMKLKDKGWSTTAIGREMGRNESSIRSLLDPILYERAMMTRNIADVLAEGVKEKGMIDVGLGVESHLGVSRTKLKAALYLLKEEGYDVAYVKVPLLGTNGKSTWLMVLKDEATPYADVYANREKIGMIMGKYSEDGGRSILGLEPIKSISSDRLMIRYGEEGGSTKDGVIEIRRGVEDLSLQNARYAQVRIGVDGTHFIKGMAMYSDDLPAGVDILFNTNKSAKLGKLGVLKPLGDVEENPFGAIVRQFKLTNGELSPINIVNEEGDWAEWSKNLSSQMVSKQPPAFAKKQLEKLYDMQRQQYDEINSLTHPAVKTKLLKEFSDEMDSYAAHLDAAGLPRQSWAVILPITDMRPTEIYAPNHRDGETVVLIRYPHGGTFEIPELVVNNKQKTAKSLLQGAEDAVGIHPDVAQRLSGADFDGDTVLVIPNNNKSVKTSAPLKGLKDFDPKISYKGYEGMPVMKETAKGKHMGDISNLITDMTIKGATPDEIARAVRHSMVVIDAPKWELDYKRSYEDNGISALKEKYQGGANKGASTIISKAGSPDYIPAKKTYVKIDKKTGKYIYEDSGEMITDKDGKQKPRLVKTEKMYTVDDAFQLSSGTTIENIYAAHANKLKALANEARIELVNTKPSAYSPSARKTYSKEVETLMAKLNSSIMNKPHERQAQLLANFNTNAIKNANPGLTKKQIAKIKGQAITEARARVGSNKNKIIDITPREWSAIMAGALTHTTIAKILNAANPDKVRAYATPKKDTRIISDLKIARAKTMLNAGRTKSEIADALGISVTTLKTILD